AFVQHHGDVAPEHSLNFDRDLRTNERRSSVDVILKLHAFLRDLAQLGQEKDLITATIGQDRAVPTHKTMQSAEVPNDIETRPNKQVIGVAQNDLRVQLAQFAWSHRFD